MSDKARCAYGGIVEVLSSVRDKDIGLHVSVTGG